jgi:hypothetical protein
MNTGEMTWFFGENDLPKRSPDVVPLITTARFQNQK